jgi:hypothetical protein
MRAFKHKQHTEFLKTRCIVEAIAYAGTDNISKVNETLNALLGMLVPEIAEDKTKRVDAMRGKLDKLKDMGPFKVRAMDEGGFAYNAKRKQNRVEK